jgi:hypothetical protein
MDSFPRTTVGGVELSRMIIGTNWFLGYSHTSSAKDKFIHEHMTRERIAEIIAVFLDAGVDAIMGPHSELMLEAIAEAQDRTGQPLVTILTPHINILPEGDPELEPGRVFDAAAEAGATFCFPHSCCVDAMVDRMHGVIRDMERYSAMIRERGMIPGLSTHLPQSVTIADKTDLDVATYIQLYNAAGFLMPIEVDWAMRIIRNAKKPVMTIKPLAAGALLPVVGLGFVWSTLRDCDMVTIGTLTPDEAREVIDISLDLLSKRTPDYPLQATRSKRDLAEAVKA